MAKVGKDGYTQFPLRLEPGERQSLEEVAEKRGETLTGFIRWAIYEACQESGVPWRGTKPIDSASRWSEQNKLNRAASSTDE